MVQNDEGVITNRLRIGFVGIWVTWRQNNWNWKKIKKFLNMNTYRVYGVSASKPDSVKRNAQNMPGIDVTGNYSFVHSLLNFCVSVRF